MPSAREAHADNADRHLHPLSLSCCSLSSTLLRHRASDPLCHHFLFSFPSSSSSPSLLFLPSFEVVIVSSLLEMNEAHAFGEAQCLLVCYCCSLHSSLLQLHDDASEGVSEGDRASRTKRVKQTSSTAHSLAHIFRFKISFSFRHYHRYQHHHHHHDDQHDLQNSLS